MNSSLQLFSLTKVARVTFKYAINHQVRTTTTFRTVSSKRIGPLGWFLLVVPSATFGLGTWQVQRKRWKENLVEELHTRTNSDPIELPNTLEEISQLEYYPVHVRGQFLHDQELYLGPRSLLQHGDASTKSSLISKGQSGASSGYLVITPFKLENRDETILVNRGWVSNNHRNPDTRLAGQIKGTTDVIGIIRLQEDRYPFMPKNQPGGNCWFYRDVNQMCQATGADPIFLDATDEFDVKGGPIGGQTRITLRNEHLSYILTWYSLSAITAFMWYSSFVKGVKI
ncbi:hypothetical protein FQR65_LT00283 [Abscondita terminalis]|nr:hypothetical protein FQR65_LT00283 [Abscondita terminalis]